METNSLLVTKNFLVKVQLSKAAIFSCKTTTRILKQKNKTCLWTEVEATEDAKLLLNEAVMSKAS